MRNLKMTVAYDGTNFSGWQVQPDKPTVQEAIESAIEKIVGTSVRVLAAGRTDAGVHAIGQVVNFRTHSDIGAEQFRLGIQSHLPPEIVIREIREVPLEFHATFSAVRKRYNYVIHQSGISSPFLRRYTHWVRGDLDLDAMNRGAQFLWGKHDFRCFETQWPNKATSVRTIQECRVMRCRSWMWDQAGDVVMDEGDGPFVILTIQADGFLYNMVRTIMGTLLKVGQKKWPAEHVQTIVENRSRNQAGPTAPAHGLYMMQVDYGGADELHGDLQHEGPIVITRNHQVLLDQATDRPVKEMEFDNDDQRGAHG